MLRIIVREDRDPIVLKVEGQLRGLWVIELDKCWRSTAVPSALRPFLKNGSLRVLGGQQYLVAGKGK